MAIRRAHESDTQACWRLEELINHIAKRVCFYKSNTRCTKCLFQINMYQSWFRYQRYWIQFWSVTRDDPLLATSLYFEMSRYRNMWSNCVRISWFRTFKEANHDIITYSWRLQWGWLTTQTTFRSFNYKLSVSEKLTF